MSKYSVYPILLTEEEHKELLAWKKRACALAESLCNVTKQLLPYSGGPDAEELVYNHAQWNQDPQLQAFWERTLTNEDGVF